MLRRKSRVWRKGLVFKASSFAFNQTRWYNKRILRKSYLVPQDFSWIENYKLNYVAQNVVWTYDGNDAIIDYRCFPRIFPVKKFVKNDIYSKKNLANKYMLKVNKKDTRTRCELFSKFTRKASERCHWRRSDVFIASFERISHFILVLLLLTFTFAEQWIKIERKTAVTSFLNWKMLIAFLITFDIKGCLFKWLQWGQFLF